MDCKVGYLPAVNVALTNLDVDREPATIQDDGDDRGGRLARWRIVVHDAKGSELPQKPAPRAGAAEPSRENTLDYEESWTACLPMRNYVDIVVPGKYTVQILYHDEIAISDCERIDGMVVCKSLPLKLTVSPIEVEISDEGRHAVHSYIRGLPAVGPVKILGGV